jgi:hypothetical protein
MEGNALSYLPTLRKGSKHIGELRNQALPRFILMLFSFTKVEEIKLNVL